MKYIELCRINNWIKNTFIFLPIFFSGKFFLQHNLIHVIFGFFYFSFAASSIYIINDYLDRQKDSIHPIKRFRPMAAGKISPVFAIMISLILILIALAGGYYLNPFFFKILFVYFILNIFYSFGLKNISIIDVFIISIGFLLRLMAGAELGDAPLSMWLKLMIFLLALFMALGKRRDDVILLRESGIEMRKSIDGYNMEFLNVTITMVCSIILVCYLMYTISPEVGARLNIKHLYYTSLFVFIGIFRYLQLIFVRNDSGSPVKIIYKDYFLKVTILLWILSFYFLIYVKDITI